MGWMVYTTAFDNRQMAIRFFEDGSVVSGVAEFMPDYLAWVAEGNIAEEWNPNGNQ